MFYAMFQHQTQITDVECNVYNIVLAVNKNNKENKEQKNKKAQRVC